MAMSYDGSLNDYNRRMLQQQEEISSRERQRTISNAMIVRERRIYAFKREFFLTVAASSMAVKEANTRADEAIAILYPAVTPENAAEYLNRA